MGIFVILSETVFLRISKDLNNIIISYLFYIFYYFLYLINM